MPASQLLKLDSQICFQFYAATNLIGRVYRPLLEPLGLTYPQYLVMLVLWESGPVTVRALCERLMLESGTLSPLLKRLQQQRLVKKAADPDDARRVIVSLTTKGDALREAAAEVPRSLLCRLLEQGGSPESFASLHSQLQALVSAWSTNSQPRSDNA
ncbi:MAG: MarR family transcriptional regulator [Archangium gephyra]|uniref:MarR family transcriptional regulator n=1 Tax=Archangium gephyra TaxID=48 RepID=A0A2W5UQV3_9BACT|nr:MAG: MarR family transcriptional regulator [Archangium gephyra]